MVIRPIKTPHHIKKNVVSEENDNISNQGSSGGHFQTNLVSVMKLSGGSILKAKSNEEQISVTATPTLLNNELNISDDPDLINLARNLSETLTSDNNQLKIKSIGAMSASNSTDFLSASPLFGYSPFDTQSLDELATPDDFHPINFIHGLTNINYDFDISDNSNDNSVAEDDKFVTNQIPTELNFDASQAMSTSILDSGDSPNEILLPSPIKPIVSDYKGFSFQGTDIPTISCNTGDFSSLLNCSQPSCSSTVSNSEKDEAK